MVTGSRDQQLAKREVIDERAIRLVEERDACVADDPGGRPLLGLADRGELERVCFCIFAALVLPLVQHTSQPLEPSEIQRAAVAAGPKSASSGWATMSMKRSGRHACGASIPGVPGVSFTLRGPAWPRRSRPAPRPRAAARPPGPGDTTLGIDQETSALTIPMYWARTR